MTRDVVRVGVHVDETRGNVEACGVDHIAGGRIVESSHPRDPPVEEGDVGADGCAAAAVQDHAVADEEIVLRRAPGDGGQEESGCDGQKPHGALTAPPSRASAEPSRPAGRRCSGGCC